MRPTIQHLILATLVARVSAAIGAMPEKRECPNSVGEHMALPRQLGLRGTPFTIPDTGRAIGGYTPAPELVDSLESDKRSGKP